MNKDSYIYVAGHNGLVGSAIVRNLKRKGYRNIIRKTHKELDLTKQEKVREFFQNERPEYVFLAAAKVGGINANNTYPADFIYVNLEIQNNIIKAAHDFNVNKLLFLGSSCIYPKISPQPIKEEYLLSGYLETTNEAYALAKIAGLKMCQFFKKQYGDNFISCMPTNLYGPNDNFHLQNSHVLPAFIRKFHEAKVNNKPFVELWGTGKVLREFLYVDDMAEACVYLIKNYNGDEHVNVGTGKEIIIKDLAILVKDIIEFDGEIKYNTDKPDGILRKLLDVSKLERMGWKYKIELRDGIKLSYKWYKENYIGKS